MPKPCQPRQCSLAQRGRWTRRWPNTKRPCNSRPRQCQSPQQFRHRAFPKRADGRGNRGVPKGPGNQLELRRSPQQPRQCTLPSRAGRRGDCPNSKGPGNQPQRCRSPQQPWPRLSHKKGQVDEAIDQYQKGAGNQPQQRRGARRISAMLCGCQKKRVDERSCAEYQRPREMLNPSGPAKRPQRLRRGRSCTKERESELRRSRSQSRRARPAFNPNDLPTPAPSTPHLALRRQNGHREGSNESSFASSSESPGNCAPGERYGGQHHSDRPRGAHGIF